MEWKDLVLLITLIASLVFNALSVYSRRRKEDLTNIAKQDSRLYDQLQAILKQISEKNKLDHEQSILIERLSKGVENMEEFIARLEKEIEAIKTEQNRIKDDLNQTNNALSKSLPEYIESVHRRNLEEITVKEIGKSIALEVSKFFKNG